MNMLRYRPSHNDEIEEVEVVKETPNTVILKTRWGERREYKQRNRPILKSRDEAKAWIIADAEQDLRWAEERVTACQERLARAKEIP
jgi:hypothetical protein